MDGILSKALRAMELLKATRSAASLAALRAGSPRSHKKLRKLTEGLRSIELLKTKN